jgi:uncharacterized protein (UPF0276 family)
MSFAGLAGVGIGLRREIAEPLLATARHLDWIEVVTENFAGLNGRPCELLRRARDRWRVVPHGVSLSVGSGAPEGYLDVVSSLVRDVDAPFFSDHLCYASVGAHAFLDLLPLPFSAEAVEVAAANAARAAARVGRPLLLENVSYYATMPGGEMDEPTFLGAVLEAAGPDVGLLLDVNNLYVNAVNHGQDPFQALAAFPLSRVRQLHLAGHTREGDVLLDTHSTPIAPQVWELYREVLRCTGPLPTLVEWDQHIPDVDAVLDEADRARAILEAA